MIGSPGDNIDTDSLAAPTKNCCASRPIVCALGLKRMDIPELALFNPLILRVPLEIVVWNSDTFDHNF